MEVRAKGDHWVIDDGTDTLSLCPCCLQRFRTQVAAVRAMDHLIEAAESGFDDAVETERLLRRLQPRQ